MIEILVALFLMVVIITTFVVGSGMFSSHQKIEEALNNIERAIRFAADESSIRNKIVRVHFNLETEPNQISVEYGPDENFILPKRITDFGNSFGISETEQRDKELKKLSKQFSKVEEFEDSPLKLSDQVKIIAIGSSLGEAFFTEGEASIYFYPSGEKDSAIIILGTENEIAALKSEAFTMDLEREITPLEEGLGPKLYGTQLSKAKELYEKWSKE